MSRIALAALRVLPLLCLLGCAGGKGDSNSKSVPLDAEAQFELGRRFYFGMGVTQDFTSAFEWFRRAAEQGHAEAEFHMGLMYDGAEGVTRDGADESCILHRI